MTTRMFSVLRRTRCALSWHTSSLRSATLIIGRRWLHSSGPTIRILRPVGASDKLATLYATHLVGIGDQGSEVENQRSGNESSFPTPDPFRDRRAGRRGVFGKQEPVAAKGRLQWRATLLDVGDHTRV